MRRPKITLCQVFFSRFALWLPKQCRRTTRMQLKFLTGFSLSGQISKKKNIFEIFRINTTVSNNSVILLVFHIITSTDKIFNKPAVASTYVPGGQT